MGKSSNAFSKNMICACFLSHKFKLFEDWGIEPDMYLVSLIKKEEETVL